MKKHVFYSEFAYLIGVFLLAAGTALTERADFGVSMVVAPAYILHLKISEFLPFFSFGMAEYTLQAVLILGIMLLLRKAKLSYLFSFVTAVIYGLMLDGLMAVIALFPMPGTVGRIILFAAGLYLSSGAVSLLFHTYLSPAAYELFVKEVSGHFGKDIHRFKTVYDCVSLIVSVALSFAFFGLWQFRGVYWGTLIAALVNGFMISRHTKFLENRFEFRDRMKWRKHF